MFARWKDPLRAFAKLELGTAAAALLVLAVLPLYRAAYPVLYGAFGDAPGVVLAAKAVLAGLLLLLPAFLMGGTLPALQEAAVRGPGKLTIYVGMTAVRAGWRAGYHTPGLMEGSTGLAVPPVCYNGRP